MARRRRRKARSNPRRRRARTASGRFRANPTRRRKRRVTRARANPRRARRRRRNPSAVASAAIRGARRGQSHRARRAQAGGTGSGYAGEMHGPPPPKSKRTRRTKGGKTLVRKKRKPGPKRGHKRKGKRSTALAGLRKTSVALGRRIKRSKGKGRASRQLRRVMRARRSAIRVRMGYDKLSSGARKMAKAHGLMRVNPSLGALGKDLLTLLPSIGAFAGTAVAALFITQKVQEQLDAMNNKETDLTKRTKFITTKESEIAVAAAVAVGAYGAARMIRPLNKYASAILFGGAAVVVVKLLTRFQVTNTNTDATKGKVAATDPTISLSEKLGLPIGDYVSMGGLMVNGRNVNVNGLGDYVGVGDYVPMGSIFNGSSLGRLTSLGDAQDPLGRDGDHGIRNEESVTDFSEDFDGALSGSIFD